MEIRSLFSTIKVALPQFKRHDNPPIFFMHIAKTAGSYVNYSLFQTLGNDFVEHCEDARRSPGHYSKWRKIKAWSGHVYLHSWLALEERLKFRAEKVTMLREPVAQLASHLQWIDHYNQDEYTHELHQLDPETRDVVRQIRDVDFESHYSLARYLDCLEGKAVEYFDNCQARYFVAGANGIDATTELGTEHFFQAKGACMAFESVCAGERVDHCLSTLERLLKIPLYRHPLKINSSKSRRLVDLRNEKIKDVLQSRVVVDKLLYDYITRENRRKSHV